MADEQAEGSEPQRKKGGRPRRHAPDAKRPTMAFRIGSKIHEKLIEASVANERSLSEEIERRVEASFETAHMDAVISSLLGGGLSAVIAKDIAAATKRIDPPPSSKSYEPYRRALLKAVERILAFHLPDQPPFALPTERTPAWEASCARAEMFGDTIGRMVIESAWDALVEKMARERVDLPPPSDEELATFVDSPGLMGTWARDEILKRKEGG